MLFRIVLTSLRWFVVVFSATMEVAAAVSLESLVSYTASLAGSLRPFLSSKLMSSLTHPLTHSPPTPHVYLLYPHTSERSPYPLPSYSSCLLTVSTPLRAVTLPTPLLLLLSPKGILYCSHSLNAYLIAITTGCYTSTAPTLTHKVSLNQLYRPCVNKVCLQCYRYGHLDEIWGLLRDVIPQFQLPPEPSPEKLTELDPKPDSAAPESGMGDDTLSEPPPKDGKVSFRLLLVCHFKSVICH